MYLNSHESDFRLFYTFERSNYSCASQKDQEIFAVCSLWALDVHVKCTKEEQRLLVVMTVLNLSNMLSNVTNISSYIDQIESRVSKIEIKKSSYKKARLDMPRYSDKPNMKVKTFERNLDVCGNLDKNISLSLLNSPQINITGFYSEIFHEIDSIRITSIYDLSDSKYVFNRTFDGKSELSYDL